jgi:DNA-binding response OmpR family regulator
MRVVDRPLILVADDDPSVRMTLEFVLEDEGFSVLIAGDGQRALELARDERPDAILLDQMMPKLEGREVYLALKVNEATSSIPVFVLTGMGTGPGDDWPGAHFVGKPFSPDDLVARIKGVLR